MSDALTPGIVPEAKPVEGPGYAESIKLTGDTMADLQAIAKEQGVSIPINDITASGQIMTGEAPAQPAQTANLMPQAAEQPPVNVSQEQVQTQPQEVPQEQNQPSVDVPKKFLTPDGQVDVARVQKSEASLDDMIARYKAKEREFHQLQNKANNQHPQAQVPFIPQNQAAQQQAYQQMPMLTPLEIQMAQDLLQESAMFGQQMSQAQAIAQARVMSRSLTARVNADNDAVQEVRRRLEDAERTRELQSLINQDPELMTDGMVDKLWQIRQDKPWINQSAEPWKEAYIVHQGMKQSQRHAGQVSNPNPKGPVAPAVPISPVSRVQPQVDLSNPKNLSNEQIIAALKKIYPDFRGH